LGRERADRAEQRHELEQLAADGDIAIYRMRRP
jgi:hypothetical protein